MNHLEFLKGVMREDRHGWLDEQPNEDLAVLAKSMGYDDEKGDDDEVEEEEEKSCKKSFGLDTVVDEDALSKALDRVEAAGARQVGLFDADETFADASAEAEVDATGLLKSLVDGNVSAMDTIGTSIDEMQQQLEASNRLALVSGHAAVNLTKSMRGVAEAINEHNDLLRSQGELLGELMKSLGRPEQPRSVVTTPAKRFDAPKQSDRRALTKGHVANTLMRAFKKSMRDDDHGNAQRYQNATTLIETGAQMTEDLRAIYNEARDLVGK